MEVKYVPSLCIKVLHRDDDNKNKNKYLTEFWSSTLYLNKGKLF